jgi:hypothetical protein
MWNFKPEKIQNMYIWKFKIWKVFYHIKMGIMYIMYWKDYSLYYIKFKF